MAIILSMKNLSYLVIFSENIFGNTRYKDEFQLWIKLVLILRNNEYNECSLTEASAYYSLNAYSPINFQDNLIDIQLKFFLLRNSEDSKNNIDLSYLINSWVVSVEKLFSPMTRLTLLPLKTLNNSYLTKFGKYYYNTKTYLEYADSWDNCTVDLNTWRKFKFLLLPESFEFVKPILEKKRAAKFPFHHLRMLFDEHANQLFLEKFKPRLQNKLLSEADRYSIERVLQNNGTDDDKKHLSRMCSTFYHWKTLPEILFKCVKGEDIIPPNTMDINSPDNYAGYFALIKYFQELTSEPKKPKAEKYAMWFKNLPKDKNLKSEFYTQLKDVFNYIRQNCPNASWADFKNLFNERGVKTKIVWTGSQEVLRYLFVCFGSKLKYEGGKNGEIDHPFPV